MAVSGVASFIQQNTKLVYNSGLWHDLMPLNLLWTVAGKLSPRPRRAMPTWSWASVDGIVLNRLTEADPLSDKQFRSRWTELTILVDDEVELLTTTKINDLVMNSRIVIVGRVWPFKHGDFTVLWDISDVPVAHDNSTFGVIPILLFSNPQIHPLLSKRQMHGLVVHQLPDGSFERLGYCWTARACTIDAYLAGTDASPPSQKVILV